MTNKVIAKELNISPGTVRVYLSDILVKLGVANRTEAAMVALRRGMVDDAPGPRPPTPDGDPVTESGHGPHPSGAG
jgi:hypothetical protein